MIFFVIAAVLILWQLLSVSGLVSPILVPSLFSIGKALVRDTLSGLLPAQLLFPFSLLPLGRSSGPQERPFWYFSPPWEDGQGRESGF